MDYQATLQQALRHLQTGQLQQARKLLESPALRGQQSPHPEVLFLLGVALQGMGLHHEASATYQKVLKLNARYPGVQYNLALALAAQGDYERALLHHDQALEQDAHNPWVHLNRGICLAQLQRVDAALEAFDQTLALQPALAAAWLNKGHTLRQVQRYDEALTAYQQVRTLEPHSASAWASAGVVYNDLENYEAALLAFEQALKLDDKQATTWFGQGCTLTELKRYEDALISFERALQINPRYTKAWQQRGITLSDLGRYELALAAYDQGLEVDPCDAQIWTSRGLALQAQNKYDLAEQAYQKALSHQPDCAQAHYNLAHLLLEQQDFARAWPQYEWRWLWRTRKKKAYLQTTRPLWDGQPVSHLLVWAEQGLGDQILWGSLLSQTCALAQKMTVALEPRLLPLFRRSLPEANFIALSDTHDTLTFDAHVPMGSLGQYFRKSLADFQDSPLAYLQPDAARCEALKARLTTKGKLLCGLSWRSTHEKLGDKKSLSLKSLLPLLSLPHLDFVDLQYGSTQAERDELEQTTGIRIKTCPDVDNQQDIDGLAALIAACDVVVSISNTTAHLVGALGQNVLLLLPHVSARLWYWHSNHSACSSARGQCSLWYPSVHLFAQTDDGWHEPLTQAKTYLENLTP